ncbi:hypothetical protein [Sphingomonas sp. UYP23]
MKLNDLTTAAMDSAEASIGTGPVTMVNLLWFREQPEYQAGFADAKPDVRSAYYEGYAGAFVATAKELGVDGVEVVLAGSRKDGLIAGPDDDWDDIVVVRYGSFANFRRIVESDRYLKTASPHRAASIANWRLVATGSK